MEFELKNLLKTLDLSEDVKDIEGFKKAFGEKFIAKAQIFEEDSVKEKISSATGKFAGALTTLAKREFDLTAEEVTGKKWEEIIAIGSAKKNARIKELEETVSSGGDEKVKVLSTKLEKTEKAFNDLKGLLETTTKAVEVKDQELAKVSQEYGTKFKEYKAGSLIEKAKEKVLPKLKDGLSEPDRFYLDAKIKESFVIDFDDKDEVLVLDKSGKRLQNPNKVGTFFSIDEAIEAKAIELGFGKKNNGGSSVDVAKILGQNQTQQTTTQNQNNGKPVKAVHPSALAHLERMKGQA